MVTKFYINDRKYEKIDELKASIQRRLNKIEELKKITETDFSDLKKAYSSKSSKVKMQFNNFLNNKNEQIKGKIHHLKNSFDQISDLTLETKKLIANDEEVFSGNGFNPIDSEFNDWVDKEEHTIINDELTTQSLNYIISHKSISKLSEKYGKNIIKINSESKHINKALIELYDLQQEIINDYLEARGEMIKMQLRAKEITQLISEQITIFNPAQEMVSLTEVVAGANSNISVVALSHNGCSLPPGICRVNH